MRLFTARKTRRMSPKQQNAFRPQVEALEDRRLLSAGQLDMSFGSGGLVTSSLLGTTNNNVSHGSHSGNAVQADGKIVVGTYLIGANGYENFALARYTSAGVLDTSFGPNHNGVVTTAVGAKGSWINGIAIDTSGRIVAVGHAISRVGNSSYYVAFAAARYTTSGSLDTTFGSGGVVLSNFAPANAYTDQTLGASAIVIQPDGKIDSAGTAQTVTVTGKGNNQTTTVTTNFALVRYNTNGSPDAGFGSGGIVVTPQFGGGPDNANAMALQQDGKIVLAGGSFGPNFEAFAVARYTPAGQLDTTFNGSGTVILPKTSQYNNELRGVVVQDNGGIVVAGLTSPHGVNDENYLTLARLTNAGTLDSSFGNQGFVINTSVLSANAIAKAPNGDLLTCGVSGDWTNGTTFDFAVTAYLPSGAPDISFGTNGVATVDFSGTRDGGSAIALQSDGKIVAVGSTQPAGGTTRYIGLARLQAPNTKITSFTANPNPVTAGSLVTLSASGILNSNPTTIITQVAFYLDDGDGNLEPGTDTLLGYGTNVNGAWSFSFTPTTSGTFTLFAVAVDSAGVWSDPAALTLTVMP